MSWTKRKRKLLKKITTKEDSTSQGISYEIFANTPVKAKLTADDIGKRVWIASYPRTTKAVLKKIDGDMVKIKFLKKVPYYALDYNEVMLHPSEWTKERFYEQK